MKSVLMKCRVAKDAAKAKSMLNGEVEWVSTHDALADATGQGVLAAMSAADDLGIAYIVLGPAPSPDYGIPPPECDDAMPTVWVCCPHGGVMVQPHALRDADIVAKTTRIQALLIFWVEQTDLTASSLRGQPPEEEVEL